MEVAVPEEPQKKIFRARKTMKSSDRQQLEALHSTLGTSSSAHPPSSSQADKPLVNGTHSENDKETTTSTTHSNYGLENKSEDLLTKNLEESDGKDCEKSVEVEIDKKDTCEAEASDCAAKGAPRDGSGEKTFAVDMEDALLASTFLGDSSEEKKEKSNKSSTSSLSASPSGLDCDPEVKEGFLCLSEEDDSQADGSDDQKVEGEESMHMDIEVGDQQDTSENKEVSAVALGTKRSLSEEENEPQELQERDEKRARMDGEELEAQLELKITATAGSRHKLEKVVQQLVEERLRVLELTVFDGNLKELKERVDKIETTNKQQNLQQQMNTLQAKIARLSKKFGAANQASENSKRANETRAPQSNTTPQQRTVKTTVDPKPSPVSTNTTTVPAQPKPLSTPNTPNSSTLASQAPILQIISTTTSSTPSSTSLPGPSQTGTLLLKTGPNTGVMTSTPVSSGGQPMSIQPLLIQLPLAMTNGQSGALVNAAGGVGLIPVSSLSSVSGINKVKTTTPATTFIIQKSAGSGALSSVTSSTPAMSLARVVNPGGTGTVSSPSTGISVTTARTPAQCAAVVGASTGVTATGTTGPAATGSAAAAPGPPLSSALTTKTGTSVLLLKLVSDNMGRTRESYTVDFKLGVVLFAEEHGNHMAARKFGVNRSCVIRWIKNKQTLLTANRNAQSFRGPRTGRYPDIEDGLLEYFRTLQDDECTITREMLQLKAGELARKNNIPTSEFKASTGWVVRFMRRKGLAIRKRKSQCQELAKDYADKLLEFRKFMTCQRESQQYLPSQIGYADQTSVFFDTSRNAKKQTEGVPTVSVKTTGFEKICCTVMLAVTADGGKLPPYVIFKRKKTPKGNFPNGIHVRIQEKGWMRGDLVEDWINAVWERRPGALLQQRSLLVLDSFRGHLGDDIKSRLEARETDLAIIPRGLTKMLQPLDASINKPFDYYLHWLFNNWMAGDNHEMTKCGHIKRPNLETICRWILDAWALITPEVIVSSLKKTGISNELDGTEDHLLWEEIGEIEDFSSVDDVSISSDSSEDKD